MKPLIGITGKAGAGKDTLYKTVLAPLLYERIALADPLRALIFAEQLARTGYEAERGKLHLPTAMSTLQHFYYKLCGTRKSDEARAELQRMGTDVVRNQVDPGVWLSLALNEAWALIEEGKRIAITDIRFPNEGAAIRGDALTIETEYAERESKGQPYIPRLRWQLTHQRHQFHLHHGRGLLPAPGEWHMVRVTRLDTDTTLSGANAGHVSESHAATLPVNLELRAGSVAELRSLGESLLS